MPFIPDVYDFIVPLRLDGTTRYFGDHPIELIFAGDKPRALHIERARRSNSSELIDPTLWRFGNVRPFVDGSKGEGVYVVPLRFDGETFSKRLLEPDARKSMQRSLEFIKSRARLHLEVKVDEKHATNLFLKLDYRLTKYVPIKPGEREQDDKEAEC